MCGAFVVVSFFVFIGGMQRLCILNVELDDYPIIYSSIVLEATSCHYTTSTNASISSKTQTYFLHYLFIFLEVLKINLTEKSKNRTKKN